MEDDEFLAAFKDLKARIEKLEELYANSSAHNNDNNEIPERSLSIKRDEIIRDIIANADEYVEKLKLDLPPEHAVPSISYAQFTEIKPNDNSFRAVQESRLRYTPEKPQDYITPNEISVVSSAKFRTLVAVLDLQGNVTTTEIVEKTGRSRSVESNYLNQLWKEGLLIKKQSADGTIIFNMSDKGRATLDKNYTDINYAENLIKSTQDANIPYTIEYPNDIKRSSQIQKENGLIDRYASASNLPLQGDLPLMGHATPSVINAPSPFLMLREKDEDQKFIDTEDYHGVSLDVEECTAMFAIEEYLGTPIPQLNRVEWNSFGFASKNGHVLALGLFNVGLKSLPEKIGALHQLQWFGLANNTLTSLPASIGNLTALETLDLDENQLETLPASIGSLKALIRLNLRKNLLLSLPNTIGSLGSLVHLDISENNLDLLPVSITKLAKLQFLLISSNPLQSISPKIEEFIANFKS